MSANEAFSTYFNARVRGMRSRLFNRAQFDELLEAGSEQAIVDRLLNSPYSEDMAQALTIRHGANAVEEAVSRNLVETFRKLLRAATDESYGSVVRVFLTRWDLAAVKALLRMRHHGLDVDDAQALVPGPSLTVAIMEDLARRDSMASLIAGLIAWNGELCAPLQRAMPAYEQDGQLVHLEEALDRAYFPSTVQRLEEAAGEDAVLLLHVVRMEIDRINMRILFALRDLGDRSELRQRLLPGGALRGTVLNAMAGAESAEQAMEFLESTPYRLLAEGVYELAQTGRYAQVERLFERQLLIDLRRTARVHILSAAVFMEYVWLKYNEVINLRLIARGEERHVPRGRIREELVYV